MLRTKNTRGGLIQKNTRGGLFKKIPPATGGNKNKPPIPFKKNTRVGIYEEEK